MRILYVQCIRDKEIITETVLELRVSSFLHVATCSVWTDFHANDASKMALKVNEINACSHEVLQ